jgi:hypothetical protein
MKCQKSLSEILDGLNFCRECAAGGRITKQRKNSSQFRNKFLPVYWRHGFIHISTGKPLLPNYFGLWTCGGSHIRFLPPSSCNRSPDMIEKSEDFKRKFGEYTQMNGPISNKNSSVYYS